MDEGEGTPMTEVCIDTGVFQGRLPPVCAKCGAPTGDCRDTMFFCVPPSVWFFPLPGPLHVALFAGLLGPNHTLRLPLCAAHGDPWLPRNLCAGLSLVCLAALVLAAYFDMGTGAAVIPRAAYVGAAALAVGSAFTAAVLNLSVIRATQITNSSVRLSGVSTAFAEAIAEEERYFDGPPLDDSDDSGPGWGREPPGDEAGSVLVREGAEARPTTDPGERVGSCAATQPDWPARYAASLRDFEAANTRARHLADEESNYAAAVELLESVPEHLRDNHLLREARARRDRVAWLDQELRAAARQLRRRGLRPLVEELLTLDPKRSDLLPLLAELPPYEPGDVLLNSAGMRLALLPAGAFLMGSPDSDPSRYADEQPQRRVGLSRPFFLGIHPVTQAQFGRVLGRSPSYWKGADRPVERVSWGDAVEFCRRLSGLPAERRAGRVYRLPTEAEWEYACRAGAATRYPFGEDERDLAEYAWFDRNSGSRTHEVGTRRPNAWGLYDMAGNVWEWCADWYGGRADEGGPVSDPTGPAEGEDRVLRGGSWGSNAWTCRAAYRNSSPPDVSSPAFGFRVVLVSPPPGKEVPPASGP
jgi:formylglycine-generating enzyme required for sulfatase activity